MNELPHLYRVKVEGQPQDSLRVSAENLPDLTVAAPLNFGGPGDQWSPEDLLMAAVANCLVLSFKAISRASKLEWLSIECESEGELDRVDRKTQFTRVSTIVKLVIPAAENIEKAGRLLNKAEETCLITNSLSCESHLECEILIAAE